MQIIATAGHVDHGKSTLIRLLTGMEPDRWAEEHRRGMTIDLGFAWTTLPSGNQLAFVDVPGHERFVTNMLAGVGEVPAVMFVVAADAGWMPQSHEHAQALNALGVRHGVLAITRCDLADPLPAQRQAQQQLGETSLAGMPTVWVSGSTGKGLPELSAALERLTDRLPLPDPDSDTRLWIDRAFSIHGAGTVVTGTLAAGCLHAGQRLRLHRGDRGIAVRGLQCMGREVSRVQAPARVALNLRGVDSHDVRRGDALLVADRWLSTDVVDVRLHGAACDSLPQQLMLHVGSAAVRARLRPLGHNTARLSLQTPLPLRMSDRAILRDPGNHAVPAGALILDVRPPQLCKRGAAQRRAAELNEIGDQPDGTSELRRRRVIRRADLGAMGFRPPVSAPTAGDWLIDATYRDELGRRLAELITEHHRQCPYDGGLPAEQARQALDLPDPALLSAILLASAATEITERGGKLSIGTPCLPDSLREPVNAVLSALAEAPFAAPTAEQLRELGLDSTALAAAVRAGELRTVAPGIVLLPDALERAVERLSALPEPFTLSQARQALATTRRVAVPLLETLQRHRHSQRLPDGLHRLR